MYHDVHGAHRLTQIHHDEKHTHEDSGDGKELAQNGQLSERLVVVKVVGQNHHHRRGRDTDQERELSDIKAPGNIPAEPRSGQTFVELL